MKKYLFLTLFLFPNILFGQQVLYEPHINILETNKTNEIKWLNYSDKPFDYILDRYITFINPDNDDLVNELVTIQIIAIGKNKKRILDTFYCNIGENNSNHLYSFLRIKENENLIFEINYSSIDHPKLIFDIFSKSKENNLTKKNENKEIFIINDKKFKEKPLKKHKNQDKSFLFKALKFTVELSSNLL